MSQGANSSPQFEAVGGHKSSIFYGQSTRDGRSTLRKTTTAWEVLYYLAMELAKDGEEGEGEADAAAAASNGSDSIRIKFIHAMGKLASLTPTLFALRFPAKFVPKAVELHPYVGQRGKWIVLEEGSPARTLVGPLFHELFDGAESLKGFDGEYDTGVWGIGLVNEASGMTKTCAMDVKIGFIRHSPLTPQDKVARVLMKEHNSLMRHTALRICGCHRYISADPSNRRGESEGEAAQFTRELFGKEIGYAVSDVAELSTCLKLFFSSGVPLAKVTEDGTLVFPAEALADVSETEKCKADKRIADIRAAIRALLQFFEETPQGIFLLQRMAFVSTSVLLFYDAAASPAAARLRLIDFARSTWRKFNYDESTVGFVQGLKNLDAYLS
ncbi:hypothetical protein ABB37_00547 [Leptomonas pyrrhocoris]|uniref:Kinase n=1 Tax=Leptomonas pyrrhocoris TaxID=157538 RepID=A0A0N0VI14_LEPPY|nr:hypothetical protein ABB37_00547 [Leptomonas pyrrhocoris]KPA86344.1 hypothetical protein ABB37_00547 [Leptomonas pyrrhocoris]|eukprot:XP_015664783.1 hypothetical protein ABB37_00547 [Leptomonas pyrrhocoris]